MTSLHDSCQQLLHIIVSTMISSPAGDERSGITSALPHPTNDHRTTTCSCNPTNRFLSRIDWTVSSDSLSYSIRHTKYNSLSLLPNATPRRASRVRRGKCGAGWQRIRHSTHRTTSTTVHLNASAHYRLKGTTQNDWME